MSPVSVFSGALSQALSARCIPPLRSRQHRHARGLALREVAYRELLVPKITFRSCDPCSLCMTGSNARASTREQHRMHDGSMTPPPVPQDFVALGGAVRHACSRFVSVRGRWPSAAASDVGPLRIRSLENRVGLQGRAAESVERTSRLHLSAPVVRGTTSRRRCGLRLGGSAAVAFEGQAGADPQASRRV